MQESALIEGPTVKKEQVSEKAWSLSTFYNSTWVFKNKKLPVINAGQWKMCYALFSHMNFRWILWVDSNSSQIPSSNPIPKQGQETLLKVAYFTL